MTAIECKFKFKCPKQWTELSCTKDSSVRFCDHCQSDVHWVNNEEEFHERALKGECVATDILLGDGDETLGLPLSEV
jgi:hypothetical protein